MTTHPIPQEVEEKLAEFNDLHVVSIAIQSGMMAGNNTEEDCLNAYQRIEDWLRQTLLSVYNSGREKQRRAIGVKINEEIERGGWSNGQVEILQSFTAPSSEDNA